MVDSFKLVSDFRPKGDQPQAIKQLLRGIKAGQPHQVLLGVTGSGKTFTVANVIEQFNLPTLILAPNKTLAAQLYGEFKEFFPDNAVEYFVSYYDYYQPEAYIPQADLYIEKDSSINEAIDRMRHSATRSLLERQDVIIVASVSCIYGLGSPEAYHGMLLYLEAGMEKNRREVLRKLVEILYERNDLDFHRGTFRVRGDRVEIFPAYEEDRAIRIEFFGDEIESIKEIDPLRGKTLRTLAKVTIYPASHYVIPESVRRRALLAIEAEMKERVLWFESQNKLIEAQRIKERTSFDLEMMKELGFCHGIENYSRHLTGRTAGEPPPTLLDYLPRKSLMVIDESHIAVPQLRGMYRGDRSRKETLVEYGFRLPSALDNRPLHFDEFKERVSQLLYVSATPGPYELEQANGRVVEQVVRPTGLMDPKITIKPATHQVDDLLGEIRQRVDRGERVLVTTLTKRMAEDLTEYYQDLGVKVRYLHSDINTLERMEIIRDLRLGVFDVLVGHQSPAGRPGSPRGLPGGHPGRGQGGLLKERAQPHPDLWPGRPQRPGGGAVLRRPYHPLHAGRHGRDPPPAAGPARLQPGPRHHSGDHQELHQGHPVLGVRGRLRHRAPGRRGAGLLPGGRPSRARLPASKKP